MNLMLSEALIAASLVFCRIGACLMLAPGFSSSRFPMQFRILLAVAASLALLPLLWNDMAETVRARDGSGFLGLMISELLVGIMIGLLARCFVIAVQFSATFIANAIGLAGIPGIPIDDSEGSIPFASLISLSATMVLLAAGLHVEILRALVGSYTFLQPGLLPQPEMLLQAILDTAGDTFLLAARLAAPFAAYAVIVNMALGFASRFTPMLQVYFVSTGAIIIGGFFLLAWVLPDWLLLFATAYRQWLLEFLVD